MTAPISLPDALFETAEQTAEQLGISRNTLFENALLQYLRYVQLSQPTSAQVQEKRNLKEQFDAVYDKEDSRLDPLFVELRARSLPQEDEW